MGDRKYTEARKANNKKWDAENTDRISLVVPKGTKDQIKARAAQLGESANGYIKRLILEDLGKSEDTII